MKKLPATTARRSLGVPDEMDYEEMSEPNMKLSRALLIVLVLHVVAVAGIIAFNAIKSRQGAVPPVSTSKASVQTASAKTVVYASAFGLTRQNAGSLLRKSPFASDSRFSRMSFCQAKGLEIVTLPICCPS